MPRTWSGTIVFENRQTGDGRVFAPGALYWERPEDVPLEWNPDDQGSHDGIEQHGYATTIARDGDAITAAGTLDNGTEHGAALEAQMEAGTAGGVSIVFDDAAMELVDTSGGEGADEPVVILASGWRFRFDADGITPMQPVGLVASLFKPHGSLPGVLVAAAGDPDPEDGEVLFEDAQDLLIQRITRGRVRAITLVTVPAFVDSRITLDAVTAEDAAPEADPVQQPVAAAARAHGVDLDRPPAEWFTVPEPDFDSGLYVEQPNGSFAVPLTITDDGQFYGHACYWGQCHVGFSDVCVSPPYSDDQWMLSQPALFDDGQRASFHTGTVVTASGEQVPIAPVFLDGEHPDLRLFHSSATDGYAHTALAWGDHNVSQGQYGIWCAGALRSGMNTPPRMRALRASAMSGDWRPVPRLEGPQLIAILTVSRPAFAIARQSMRLELAASGSPSALRHVNVVTGPCENCGQTATLEVTEDDGLAREMRAFMLMMERRTRPLVREAAAAMAERMGWFALPGQPGGS